jgi:hypothetical protein
MGISGGAWWAVKIRQAWSYVRAHVRPAEREALVAWTTPAQRALFDAMHVADRRHGLDVVARLRIAGVSDPDALVAGLLHDAGKGEAGLAPRVVHAVGQAYGHWIWRLGGRLLRMRPTLARLIDHAEGSARLAAAAGCSTRTVELIRWQDSPQDPEFGEWLRLADEAG